MISTIPPHVTPAILAATKREFLSKVKKVQSLHAPFLHLDVLDTTFVPYKCFSNADDIKSLAIGIPFEVHLMVLHPETHIVAWKKAGATRIIFHVEATNTPLDVIFKIKKNHLDAWIAISPDTEINKDLGLIFPHISGILVMGVHPGKGGQRFKPSILEKIRSIKAIAPKLSIAVDGGVRTTNMEKMFSAGANRLIAGSMIFDV